MDAYVPEACDIFVDEATYVDYTGLVYWMTSLTAAEMPIRPHGAGRAALGRPGRRRCLGGGRAREDGGVRRLMLAARVWGVRRLAVAAGAMAVVWRAFPDPVNVPGRDVGVEWVLAPLVPVLMALLVPGAAEVAHTDLERAAARLAWRRRLGVSAAAMVLLTAAARVGTSTGEWVTYTRNGALLLGLGLLATVLVPRAVRWFPALAFATGSWLLGAVPPWELPPAWAVLLHPAGSPGAALTAAAVLAAGVLVYVAKEEPFRWRRAPATVAIAASRVPAAAPGRATA